MGYDRSRSPKRRRSRSRSRERRRSPGGAAGWRGAPDAEAAAAAFAMQMQQQQMAAIQQQELQRQLLAQQMMMGAPGLAEMMMAPGGAAPMAAAPTADGGHSQEAMTIDRKQREIYIGNLAIGITTKEILYELFNQCFAHQVPDPTHTPPVVNINMDTSGRFAFVEFQTREMATKAIEMDRLVELCGRAMHIGRPKGYTEPAPGSQQLHPVPKAPPKAGDVPKQPAAPPPPPAANVSGIPTTVLLLTNLLPAGQLRTESDRRILQEEVYEEAAKHGEVKGVVVPTPTAQVQDLMPGRCYIKYASPEDCAKGQLVFHSRTLDDNAIKAGYVLEEEYQRAASGEWVPKHSGVAGMPLPGLYSRQPLVSGITGLSALNPSLAALATNNPGISAMVCASVVDDEVPFEEGYIKLRGFTPTATKQEMMQFLQGCCPDLSEEDIKVVLSADGTPLGEAFVHLHGPRAKMRLALSRDRATMPVSLCPVEILTAVEEDQQRRMLSALHRVIDVRAWFDAEAALRGGSVPAAPLPPQGQVQLLSAVQTPQQAPPETAGTGVFIPNYQHSSSSSSSGGRQGRRRGQRFPQGGRRTQRMERAGSGDLPRVPPSSQPAVPPPAGLPCADDFLRSYTQQ
ncbi:splicing factor u2af 65 kda [Micractinium conductrix]|uniref:Splicing factor u2af 65 kDa n=1 Tax=Micractinium conductrix TaxID=554055 RepID=A0A2P6VEY2_9CHLO|nr:splicing factor u2af 65 kda [Micractinium conductrix]|eukprot:PSC72638.1 splicing factor u2af 65 kda [Micractinium conductrix]